MTRKDHLVQLVASVLLHDGACDLTVAEIVHDASLYLAEIENACPKTQGITVAFELAKERRKAINEAVAEERERCAKIAEDYAKSCASSRDEVDGICEAVAELIRGAK